MLSDTEPSVRRMAVYGLAWPADDEEAAGLIGHLETHDPEAGVRTMAYLARIVREGGGADDVAAICEAITAYSDDDPWIAASLGPAALRGVGVDGLDAMAEEAARHEYDPSTWIVSGMCLIGESAVPSLLRVAGSECRAFPQAAGALVWFRQADPLAVFEALGDPDPAVRLGATRALGWDAGALEPGHVKRLMGCMYRDPDERVRLAAAMACIRQGRARERALLVHITSREPGPSGAGVAADALVAMHEESTPYVGRMLRSGAEPLQLLALRAVSQLDTAPEDLLREVGAVATDATCAQPVRRCAASVLWAHREPSGWVLALLQQVVRMDPKCREAWNGFGEYGEFGRQGLLDLQGDPDPAVRSEAVRLLRPRREPHIPMLESAE